MNSQTNFTGMKLDVDQLELENVLLPTSSLGKTLKALHRRTLSIPNRLQSITADAEFVARVANAYQLPLIANERCGSWYIPPETCRASVYFKSTDGHTGEWGFNLRRLNLHVLDIVAENGGCIIVDSTRRGKLMPDALSKTVPIWCAVINSLLFPGQLHAGRLHTPSSCVSDSEHDQIQRLLPSFLSRLASVHLDAETLRKKVSVPLHPLWVTRNSKLSENYCQTADITPIVLCTASMQVLEGDLAADGYIQGAGDDNENWSQGLTAEVFWLHHDEFMASRESDLPPLIQRLMLQYHSRALPSKHEAIKVIYGHDVYLGRETLLSTELLGNFEVIVHCGEWPNHGIREKFKTHYHHLKCRAGKLGSRDLRVALGQLFNLIQPDRGTEKIFVCCPTGTDLAVGVALYLVCILDAKETMAESEQYSGDEVWRSHLNKQFIQKRLAHISALNPSLKPSRATLLAVNDALLSRRGDVPQSKGLNV